MNNYNILQVEWRSGLWTVGFVAYDTGFDGQWNSVVGMSFGFDQDIDAQNIAANGSKLEWKVAERMFPKLDITKHKYYTGDKT